MKILQPPGWPRPRGYSNGVSTEGRLVFVAGQIGWDASEKLVSADFLGQFEQVLHNTLAVLAEGGGRAEHIVRMTWYITDRKAYLDQAAEAGRIYREVIGRHYPTMAVVEVKALMEPGALVEIESTAVIPR